MPLDRWPIEQLWPSSGGFKPYGGATGPADRPNAMSGGFVWACDMTVVLGTVQQIKLARAMLYGLDGGVTPVIVPLFDPNQAPWPLGGPLPDVPHSDGSSFSDGSLYSSGGIEASLAEDVALRATQVKLNMTAIAALEGSEHFSVDHPGKGRRMYSAIRVLGGDTFTTRPPWREASSAGTVVDFNDPGCVMRLTNFNEALGAVTPPYRSSLTLRFIEVFPDRFGTY